MPSGFTERVTWDGIEYASKAEAARKLGVRYETFTGWIDRGYSGFADMPAVRKGKLKKHATETQTKGKLR